MQINIYVIRLELDFEIEFEMKFVSKFISNLNFEFFLKNKKVERKFDTHF